MRLPHSLAISPTPGQASFFRGSASRARTGPRLPPPWPLTLTTPLAKNAAATQSERVKYPLDHFFSTKRAAPFAKSERVCAGVSVLLLAPTSFLGGYDQSHSVHGLIGRDFTTGHFYNVIICCVCVDAWRCYNLSSLCLFQVSLDFHAVISDLA
jgi:hypothetical protein